MGLEVSIRKTLSRNFSLETEFNSGDTCLAILGASGSGKSMTLKCIAGIETPDEGHIVLNGRILFDSKKHIDLKPRQRRVGYLFQNYALFPMMTVLENITIGLADKKCSLTEARKKAQKMMEQFRLSGMEHHYPAQISGGQQQRTALVRMLIREPELLLLDEPFSALDSNLREEMQLLFAELLETRRPAGDAIMVTHSRDEAYKLCADTLVMENGQVLGKGPTRKLFDNPGLVKIARMTGCKNISPIKRLGEYELFALDWGLTLVTAAPVTDSVTHVGIRAHDMVPCPTIQQSAQTEQEQTNLVRIKIMHEIEEPFERGIIFCNAETEMFSTPAKTGELWWKFSKYVTGSSFVPGQVQYPERLRLPPESLLLLS
jgi:molybdate transport system ATP-binding protein